MPQKVKQKKKQTQRFRFSLSTFEHPSEVILGALIPHNKHNHSTVILVVGTDALRSTTIQ